MREAQGDSNTSKEILTETKNLLEESRKDSKSLTNTVSILTLLFLPGTFISVGQHKMICQLRIGGANNCAGILWHAIFRIVE